MGKKRHDWSEKEKTALGMRCRKSLTIFAFLAPILTFSLLFVYYPFVKTMLSSLCSVNAKGELQQFVGLENFRYVFGRSDFARAVKNSLLIALINVPCTLVLTITLGRLAAKKRALSPIYETMFTLPMAISASAACMIFKSMFSPTLGIVNSFFGLKLGWFESRDTALYTCLILTVWMGVGFDFLLFQSAFRAIPKRVMEAAELDGAGFFVKLFRVELPLISPTIFYVLCTNAVLAMMTSAPMIIITQGGPSRSTTTLMYMMYASGYGSSNFSLAAVVSMVAFAMTFGLLVLALYFERKKVHYQ